MKSLTASPNYVGLVKFLVQPFLESPESLSVDCEISENLNRTWIRIAFETTDKGKVFGRGGRNIQAIRTVIAAAAELAGQSVYLDIYGSSSQSRDGMSFDEEQEERIPPPKSRERSGSIPMPVAKPRSRLV
ncbi:KH domain-containing protein [Anabaena sp. PCC 7108]|uniref:KH domain-containing protein n=1 Tax=Anabaena sp. PCC 7108 TaxID=163908 RepID=UPI000348E7F0|nr:KH domain-containing protein [Anabaena sp. PCC 7108]